MGLNTKHIASREEGHETTSQTAGASTDTKCTMKIRSLSLPRVRNAFCVEIYVIAVHAPSVHRYDFMQLGAHNLQRRICRQHDIEEARVGGWEQAVDTRLLLFW